MSEQQSFNKPAPPPLHWPSLAQLVFSLLAAFILIGAAVIIVLSAIFFTSGSTPRDPTEEFMVAASLAFAGVLVLPSAWYAWQHIAYPNREPAPRLEQRRVGLILTLLVIVLVGGALWLGNWSAQNNYFTWLLLPPLNIIATGLPALWIVYIGTRGLIQGSPRRTWGVFAIGLVLGPAIILILELVLLVFLGFVALFWVMLNPSLANQLNGLVYHLQNVGPNPEAIVKLLMPLVLNPGIIFLIFAYLSILVPLLEEALKPMGVWFLAKQKLTSAQGFAFGVISGAGFGLFENLGNTSGGATGWALLASMRISTILLHCFTAGLIGWALVSAWNERRYIRLAITYMIAVVIHGLWNGLALLTLASSLQDISNVRLPDYLQQIGSLSAVGIVVLGVIVFVLYFSANYAFQRSAQEQVPSQPGGNRSLQPAQENPSPESDMPLQSTSATNTTPSSSADDPLANSADGTQDQAG